MQPTKEDAVRAFHTKISAGKPKLLADAKTAESTTDPRVETFLLEIHTMLKIASQTMLQARDNTDAVDTRLLRMALIIEEVSEIAIALCQKNEVALLDGLADLEYVTIGTAIQYDLPLDAAFYAVHASNMTKTSAIGADGGRGKHRGKGVGYMPPDIEALIKAHRHGGA